MLTYLYIFIGGGFGAVSRFGVGKLAQKYLSEGFPYGTLISNVVSCIIMGGIFYLSLSNKWLTEDLKLLLIVGFCGGFSTFSAFSLDTVNFIKSGQILLAFLNVIISVLICLAIIYLLVQKQKTA